MASVYTHSKLFKQRSFYTQRSFYKQQAFTQRSFYTQQAFTHRLRLHTEHLHTVLLHMASVYTHRKIFKQRSFYTQKLLHTTSFYTEKLLHTASFYRKKLLHRAAFPNFIHRHSKSLIPDDFRSRRRAPVRSSSTLDSVFFQPASMRKPKLSSPTIFAAEAKDRLSNGMVAMTS